MSETSEAEYIKFGTVYSEKQTLIWTGKYVTVASWWFVEFFALKWLVWPQVFVIGYCHVVHYYNDV